MNRLGTVSQQYVAWGSRSLWISKTYSVAPFSLLFFPCLHILRPMSERTLFLGSRTKRRTCLAAGKQLFSPLPLCGWLCCWLNKSCEIISPFCLLGLQKPGCWKNLKCSQSDLGQDFFMLRFIAWAADFILFWQCLLLDTGSWSQQQNKERGGCL